MNGHTLFVYDFRNHIASIWPRTFHLAEEADCLRQQQFRRKSGWENWRMRSKKRRRKKPAPGISETNSRLLRAGYIGVRQDSLIREAERSVDGIGGCSHLKPLQQRNVLRVVSKGEVWLLNRDGYRGIGQNLNRIALFQIVLAGF